MACFMTRNLANSWKEWCWSVASACHFYSCRRMLTKMQKASHPKSFLSIEIVFLRIKCGNLLLLEMRWDDNMVPNSTQVTPFDWIYLLFITKTKQKEEEAISWLILFFDFVSIDCTCPHLPVVCLNQQRKEWCSRSVQQTSTKTRIVYKKRIIFTLFNFQVVSWYFFHTNKME